MNVRRSYLVLGISLILVGALMPGYFYLEATTTVLVPYSTPQPAGECTVVTSTSTEASGVTHRHFNVTCSETIHLSALLSKPNATLASPVESLLSNVTAAISIVSTIATVAVALTILPLQDEAHAKKSWSTFSFLATSFLSIAIVMGFFLILALPFNVIPIWLSLALLLIMVGLTLVGFGFGIISWGKFEKMKKTKA
jgi:hypothetical protein